MFRRAASAVLLLVVCAAGSTRPAQPEIKSVVAQALLADLRKIEPELVVSSAERTHDKQLELMKAYFANKPDGILYTSKWRALLRSSASQDELRAELKKELTPTRIGFSHIHTPSGAHFGFDIAPKSIKEDHLTEFRMAIDSDLRILRCTFPGEADDPAYHLEVSTTEKKRAIGASCHFAKKKADTLEEAYRDSGRAIASTPNESSDDNFE